MGEVVALRQHPALSQAIPAFLSGHERIGSDGTRRAYRIALGQMARVLDPGATLAVFDSPEGAERFKAWYRARFSEASPRTRAQKLAIYKSAFRWWRAQGWMTVNPTEGLSRPSLPNDRTQVHTHDDIAALWEREDVPLREKTLWRMLYETAARAEEILTLNVEDLDLTNKKARVRRKGASLDWVFWKTGTARLLPRLINGRQRGPLFLSSRKPRGPVPTVDLCPVTGRARLSYRRAAELVDELTDGDWTLHDFRRDALTHDAERGTSTPMLMARSGHQSYRSLEPYIRISAEALGRHVAAQDPAARRR